MQLNFKPLNVPADVKANGSRYFHEQYGISIQHFYIVPLKNASKFSHYFSTLNPSPKPLIKTGDTSKLLSLNSTP